MDLNQHPGAYGHGGQDPIGVINILQTADVFMTVSLPGVTTAQCHRSGMSFDVIKVPPIAVHVVQWLADLKVQWRVIDMDGSVFDGLDPIYYFLKHHRLRHRRDNGQFGFDSPIPVIGHAANVFGTGAMRPMAPSSGSFVVPMSVDARMDQMGCQSPPSKISKTQVRSKPLRQSSPVKLTTSVPKKDQLAAPVPVKSSVQGTGAALTKSFEVIQGQNQKSLDSKTREFEISVPQKCKCMDSLGYLPFGCFCKSADGSKSLPKPNNSDDLRSPTAIIDSLDIHAPEDADLFGSKPANGLKTPSNTFLDQNNSPSNTFLDQKSSSDQIQAEMDEIPLQPGDIAFGFPQILPPNPLGRRVPPIFRWEVQVRRRPNDPALPSTTERRQIFMDSIRPVKFDKAMKGKEYDAVHEFEWKTCLG